MQLMRNYHVHVAKQTLWSGAEDMGRPGETGTYPCTYMYIHVAIIHVYMYVQG